MNSTITYQEYWNEIKALAESVLQEYDEESQHDGAFEAVDCHQWIIYNAYHYDVLRHCGDENAYFEQFGSAPAGNYVHEILVKLAFVAMLQDVEGAIQDLRSEKQKEADEVVS